MVITGVQLYRKIRNNLNLKNLEICGLAEGSRRGKQPDVSLKILNESLHKQYLDFLRAYGDDDKETMKKCLADLRNVAGILFLSLNGCFVPKVKQEEK